MCIFERLLSVRRHGSRRRSAAAEWAWEGNPLMLYLETLVNLARFQKWERGEAVKSRKKSFGRSSIDPRPFLYIEKQIGTR